MLLPSDSKGDPTPPCCTRTAPPLHHEALCVLHPQPLPVKSTTHADRDLPGRSNAQSLASKGLLARAARWCGATRHVTPPRLRPDHTVPQLLRPCNLSAHRGPRNTLTLWSHPRSHATVALESQDKKVFAQHNKFGITLEVDKRFLNYHLKTVEIVASSAETAQKTASPEAAARVARMAAAAKEQAQAKQAAVAAKAKAKASEKEERCLLAEAITSAAKAAKATKAAAEEVEATESKLVKPEPKPTKEQDGAAKAAEAGAAKLGAQTARPLVQARSSPAWPVTHVATYPPRSYVSFLLSRPRPLIYTGASGAEEGPDYHGGRRPEAARGYPA